MGEPWKSEPDHKEFEAHNLPCVLHRGPFGHWCGYVAIPQGHPLHGVAYHQELDLLRGVLECRMNKPVGDNPGVPVMVGLLTGELSPRPDTVFEVHGALTFSDDFAPGRVKQQGEWWFGFDCAHSGDLCPKTRMPYMDEVYRDMAYAMAEAERLAEQLAALTINSPHAGT